MPQNTSWTFRFFFKYIRVSSLHIAAVFIDLFVYSYQSADRRSSFLHRLPSFELLLIWRRSFASWLSLPTLVSMLNIENCSSRCWWCLVYISLHIKPLGSNGAKVTRILKINAHVIVFGISSTTGLLVLWFADGVGAFYIFLFFNWQGVHNNRMSLPFWQYFVGFCYLLVGIYSVFIDLLINAEVTHGGSKLRISVCINTAVFWFPGDAATTFQLIFFFFKNCLNLCPNSSFRYLQSVWAVLFWFLFFLFPITIAQLQCLQKKILKHCLL